MRESDLGEFGMCEFCGKEIEEHDLEEPDKPTVYVKIDEKGDREVRYGHWECLEANGFEYDPDFEP